MPGLQLSKLPPLFSPDMAYGHVDSWPPSWSFWLFNPSQTTSLRLNPFLQLSSRKDFTLTFQSTLPLYLLFPLPGVFSRYPMAWSFPVIPWPEASFQSGFCSTIGSSEKPTLKSHLIWLLPPFLSMSYGFIFHIELITTSNYMINCYFLSAPLGVSSSILVWYDLPIAFLVSRTCPAGERVLND